MKANKFLTVSKTGLAAMLFITLNGLNTKAQESNQMNNNKMVARLLRYEVKPEFQVKFRKAISDYVHYPVLDRKSVV